MRIETLTVRGYRALRDVTMKDLSPLTVLCGANGSGKSTFIDVFAFLHETFTVGLRAAWDKRNRMEGIRSRGYRGNVRFELKYRAPDESGTHRLVTYALEIGEDRYLPVVVSERLTWSTSPGPGRPRGILQFARGQGEVFDESTETNTAESLASPDLLAVSALGQVQRHPRVKALRDFITGWYLSYLNADATRTTTEAGPQPRLSQSGDNLANVIQFYQETHPDRLDRIFTDLARQVPRLENVLPMTMPDGRLLLRLKDRPFDEPILSKFTSDGTLRLLAYLTILHDPAPPPVIGIEEPENQLHPKVVPLLAENIKQMSGRSQVVVTTHSPEFLTNLTPRELWAIHRRDDGFADIARVSANVRVRNMLTEGASLAQLWSEGYLTGADPQGL